MTYTNIASDQAQAIQTFQRFDADTQLALLWFIYEGMKGSLTPKGGSDNNTGFPIAKGIVDRIQQCSQEEQLQAQRAIVSGQQGSEFAAAYADFNSSNRLAFWYLLAQGMEDGSIVNVPGDYRLSSEAQGFFDAVKNIEFNDQITFMRNIVSAMGPEPKEGAIVS
jgi:hypothetical protein